ncbi:MAG: hypothetical protein ABI790_05080 [Betaproteobacteria bacterium]
MNVSIRRTRPLFTAGMLMTSIALLSACSSTPAPEWQGNAQDSIERSLEAYLAGNARVDAQEFARARSQVARTGRADLLARVELMHCAGQVASLETGECAGFEKWRADAAAPERAYAEFLAGRPTAADSALLPAQQRAIAALADGAGDAAVTQALNAIADPTSRLVAAGVLFRRGLANPDVLATAVDTASSQGWRRPLLAWLGVQRLRAEKAGDTATVERLRRRMQLVLDGG